MECTNKRVGDIKKKFEIMNELSTNQPHKRTIATSNVYNINKIIDNNNKEEKCHIKRTPAFRKNINSNIKNNINNNVQQILPNCVDKNYQKIDNNKLLKSPVGVINNKSNVSGASSNSNIKPTVILRNKNIISPVINKSDNNNINYAQPNKKPIRPNYLQLNNKNLPKRILNNTDNNSNILNELKEVLTSPLPLGPPPKKPPRTFAHTLKYSPDNEFNNKTINVIKRHNNIKIKPPSSLPSHTIRPPIRSKTESHIMLNKLEHILKQHKNNKNMTSNSSDTSSISSSTSSKSKRIINNNNNDGIIKRYGMCLSSSQTDLSNFYYSMPPTFDEDDNKKNENIYAEVNTNSFKSYVSDNYVSDELHYMSTPIKDIKFRVPSTIMNEKESGVVNVTSPPHSTPPSNKVSLDVDSKIFDSEIITPSNKKIQGWVNDAYDKVLASNTDASSDSDSVTSTSDGDGIPPMKSSGTYEQLTLERKGYLKRVSSLGQYRSQSNNTGSVYSPNTHMFECLILVGIDMDNDTKSKVPYLTKKYPPQARIPDLIENCVFPDATEWPPPPIREEDQKHYTIIITSGDGDRKYGYCKRVMPEGAPVCLPLAYCILSSVKANNFYYKLLDEIESYHGQSESVQMSLIKELYSQAFPMPGQSVRISVDRSGNIEKHDLIRRPLNIKKEETDLICVLNHLNVNLFVQLLGSLLLERRVILLSRSITTLSLCIEGLQSALGPFQWQYTLISLVPLSLIEIIQSPTAYLVGILKPYENSDREISFEDITEPMFAIDLDDKKILHKVGDENTILPSKLTKALKSALDLSAQSKTLVDKNLVISEAILRLYVELIGHYKDYIYFDHRTKCKTFLKEQFVKAATVKNTQLFLEWFSETFMFNSYIEKNLTKSCESRGRFEQLCIDFCDEKAKTKKDKGLKHLGEKFKEWASS